MIISRQTLYCLPGAQQTQSTPGFDVPPHNGPCDLIISPLAAFELCVFISLSLQQQQARMKAQFCIQHPSHSQVKFFELF